MSRGSVVHRRHTEKSLEVSNEIIPLVPILDALSVKYWPKLQINTNKSLLSTDPIIPPDLLGDKGVYLSTVRSHQWTILRPLGPGAIVRINAHGN